MGKKYFIDVPEDSFTPPDAEDPKHKVKMLAGKFQQEHKFFRWLFGGGDKKEINARGRYRYQEPEDDSEFLESESGKEVLMSDYTEMGERMIDSLRYLRTREESNLFDKLIPSVNEELFEMGMDVLGKGYSDQEIFTLYAWAAAQGGYHARALQDLILERKIPETVNSEEILDSLGMAGTPQEPGEWWDQRVKDHEKNSRWRSESYQENATKLPGKGGEDTGNTGNWMSTEGQWFGTGEDPNAGSEEYHHQRFDVLLEKHDFTTPRPEHVENAPGNLHGKNGVAYRPGNAGNKGRGR